jgi:type III pantothenate kinase
MPSGTRAVGSNVGGPAVQALLEEACARHGMPLQVIRSERERLGVTNGYRDAGQLGTDRWAALLAAHASLPADQMVVNAGTALTVDALRADGLFMGGLIVAGVALMRASLGGGTAQLRLTEGRFDPFPKSTPDAITTGSVQAAVGAIERMHAAMAAAGPAPVRIVLSGGAAPALAPHLPMPVTLNDNLVLDGLVSSPAIAERPVSRLLLPPRRQRRLRRTCGSPRSRRPIRGASATARKQGVAVSPLSPPEGEETRTRCSRSPAAAWDSRASLPPQARGLRPCSSGPPRRGVERSRATGLHPAARDRRAERRPPRCGRGVTDLSIRPDAISWASSRPRRRQALPRPDRAKGAKGVVSAVRRK